jgi:HSP20 family protein
MSTLFPITRFGGLSSMDKDFETFFTTLFGDNDNRLRRGSAVLTVPRANVTHNSEGYEIALAAPGMSRDMFNIAIENGYINISSDISDESLDEDTSYATKEFGYSSFTRSWQLPDTVNADGISARYDAGILNVIIPTMEQAKSKVVIDVE